MMPYPPLGTLYAASYLRQHGISVALHDVMLAATEEEIVPAIAAAQPSVVAIYDDGFNYLSKMCLTRMRQAAFSMTQMAKERGCTVVVFSSDATDHLEEYFRHGADYVICGEAEVTLAELVQFLTGSSSQTPEMINGLAFVRKGNIIKTGQRKVLQDLDQLPFPAWDLVDLHRYRSAWKKHHGYFSLNMVTTRGCPFHCNWCAKPLYGQVYHARSPENVVAEMKYLKEFAQPDHIWFADDIFGLKPGWVEKFAYHVQNEDAKIPFKCLARVDLLLERNTLQQLREAGCETVWVGAESGSQKVLDAMEKGTTVEQIYRATSLLRRNGIRTGFFLQFGYPGEDRDDILKTIGMVKDCMPDEIGISVSYPLPGTKFYERVKNQLAGKQNWAVSQDLDLMFAGEFSPDFYRMLHRVVHKQFKIWRGLRALKALFVHPGDRVRNKIRSIASMVYYGLTLPIDRIRLLALEKAPHARINGYAD
ncbi:MAG: radical SAM protein [Bacteroidota bacterium]